MEKIKVVELHVDIKSGRSPTMDNGKSSYWKYGWRANVFINLGDGRYLSVYHKFTENLEEILSDIKDIKEKYEITY